MFGLGLPELAIIAGIMLLIFGPKRIPELGRSMGQTIRSFRGAAKELERAHNEDDDTEHA